MQKNTYIRSHIKSKTSMAGFKKYLSSSFSFEINAFYCYSMISK
jgi:hypothetical protein